jgi:hypothetical protein
MKMIMKKYLLYFLLSAPILAFAQDDTLSREAVLNSIKDKSLMYSQPEKVITSRVWELRQMTRIGDDGNFMPRELAGLTFVFKTDGTTYMYITPEDKAALEAKADNDTYVISGDKITVSTTPRKVFLYTLGKSNHDYELALTDNEAGVVYHVYAER